MLPDQVASSIPILGNFLSPRDRPRRWDLCYERGGDNINDVTNGLMSKIWTGRVLRTVGELDQIRLGVDNDIPETTIISVDTVLTFDFTFDHAMRPFIAYETLVGTFFYWYDSTIENFVTSQLPAGASGPRCTLDDKRPMQLGTSDIILAYVQGETLYARAQRDRYEIAYPLHTGVAGRLYQIGMNNRLRMQFQMSSMHESLVNLVGMIS